MASTVDYNGSAAPYNSQYKSSTVSKQIVSAISIYVLS